MQWKEGRQNVQINQVTSYTPDLIKGIIWVKYAIMTILMSLLIQLVLAWHINLYSTVKKHYCHCTAVQNNTMKIPWQPPLLRRNKIKRNNTKSCNKHNHSECSTYTYWLVVSHPSDCRVIIAAVKTTRGAGDDKAALQARQKQQTGNRPACITLQHF